MLVAASIGDASRQKDILVSMCIELGIPLGMSKLEGSSTCLTFLGIEMDIPGFNSCEGPWIHATLKTLLA